jgi:hypothetical protein
LSHTYIKWETNLVYRYTSLLKNINSPQIFKLAKEYHISNGEKNSPHGEFNFTEGWFRKSGIYDLNKDNQLKLMNWFIDNKCSVNKKKLNKKADELLLKQQAKKHLDFNLFKEADGSDILDTN